MAALWTGHTDPALAELFDGFNAERDEPVMDGFTHVADAAQASIVPILRHVRHVAHTKSPNPHSPTKGPNGTAITGERGIPDRQRRTR